MFRKNYKEAMNDIKPDAAFVESVIAASKKRRPPLRARYTKYAAAIAAAVVVVSGTVLTMPLWNKIQENTDGVISETTAVSTVAPNVAAVATAKPDMSAAASTPQPATAQAAAATEKPYTTSASGGAAKSSNSQTKPSQNNTSFAVSGSNLERNSLPNVSEPPKSEQAAPAAEASKQEESKDDEQSAAQSADSGEVQIMRSIVMGESDEQAKENSAPMDMAPYEQKAELYSAKAAAEPEISDADIPTPSGYTCTSATPRGYTFVNDDGAVITVSINYGGEERAPYIEENGDNIYAVFTSFGLSVTINASGADRSSVEEIINSLR
ncbi:MAG: hypothetical protein IJH36_13820 [Clostridia bacterium]|nr:hypothetical protein [Clostridia bacterium]